MPVDTLNTCTNEGEKKTGKLSHQIFRVIINSLISRLTVTSADQFLLYECQVFKQSHLE